MDKFILGAVAVAAAGYFGIPYAVEQGLIKGYADEAGVTSGRTATIDPSVYKAAKRAGVAFRRVLFGGPRAKMDLNLPEMKIRDAIHYKIVTAIPGSGLDLWRERVDAAALEAAAVFANEMSFEAAARLVVSGIAKLA